MISRTKDLENSDAKTDTYIFDEIKTADIKTKENSTEHHNDPAQRWFALLIISISMILSMSTWFSTGVILPQLEIIFNISDSEQGAALLSFLVVSPNIGFVIMATLLSILSLADMMQPKYWIILGCFCGALFNLMIIFVSNVNVSLCIFLRILTGACMALIYPSSVKLISSWFKYQRGSAIGVVIGALTLGTALPNLVNGFNDIFELNWKYVIISTSSLSLIGGFIPICCQLKNGPYSTDKSPFDSTQIVKCFHNKELRLAMFGYFGHNVELYAMWAWIKYFFTFHGLTDSIASFIAFGAIGFGSITCVIFGVFADKYYGRTMVILLSLFISCFCSIIIGVVTQYISIYFGIVIAFIWGAFVISDSGQYSAIITEVCDQKYIGTATVLSMAIGFTLTVITMFLIPILQPFVTWKWVYTLLSPGPIISIYCILKLRTCENAYKICNGKM